MLGNIKRILSCAFLIAFTFCGLVFVNAINLGVVHASTEVTGIISSHTTWTKENSPYSITGPIVIVEGTILTIEPGVTVNLNSYYILVNGTLYARGSSDDPIRFNGGINVVDSNGYTIYPITFTPIINPWHEDSQVGCIIEHAVLSSTSVFMASSPKICNNVFTESYIRVSSAWSGSLVKTYSAYPVISDNIFTGSGQYAIQTFHSGGLISQNTISGFSTGIELMSDTSSVVQRNYISGNTDGIKLVVHQGPVSVQIKENTITGNENGISMVREISAVNSAAIQNNNIFSNLEYNLKLSVPDNVFATSNWWGTTDTSVIDELIKDYNDDSTLGVVTYLPMLAEPDPQAPAVPAIPEPEPTPSQLSISVDTTSTAAGSAVNVNGKLQNSSGSPIQNQLVTLSYSLNGENWVSIGSDTTTASGTYAIQWVDIAAGTFTLKVDFAGNDDYLAANATTTFSCMPHEETQKAFFVESNSTVTSLTFNSIETALTFVVEGPSGTAGYVKATIPKELLDSAESWTVLVQYRQVTPTVTSDENNTYIHFTYEHSTKPVEIIGTTAIPEFSTLLLLPLLFAAATLTLLGRRRLQKTANQQSYL